MLALPKIKLSVWEETQKIPANTIAPMPMPEAQSTKKTFLDNQESYQMKRHRRHLPNMSAAIICRQDPVTTVKEEIWLEISRCKGFVCIFV